VKRFFAGVSKYIRRHFEEYNGTEKVFYGLTLLIAAAACALLLGEAGLPRPLGYLLGATAGLGLAAAALNLGSLLLNALLRFLLRRGTAFLICTAAVTVGLGYGLYESCRGNIPRWGCYCAALVMVLIVRSFVQCLWLLAAKRKQGAFIWVSGILTGALTLVICLFIFGNGFDESYTDAYLQLGKAAGREGELETGITWPVDVLYYGTGTEDALSARTVDLAPFVGGYSGLQAKYRRTVQGYDICHVPLRGKIWYPVGAENCPLLVIAHGNHNLLTESYEGYDYLGESLAAQGYVVASIDCNSCNWCVLGNLSGENDGRAVLMLENIRQILRYSTWKTCPLYDRIDRNAIAVAGHSRGGESAAIAALFCSLDCLPSNGNVEFDWNFRIRSVIAIAPTADQYNPAGHTVELSDVNYLLIQGANDQDVSVFMGARQYENVNFTGERDCLKSYLYIADANHGQFNTTWGRFDMTGLTGRLLNVENLLTAGEQQDILTTFASVFLDVTLRGEESCRDLLYDYGAYRDYLPETLYVQGYEDSGFDLLADFEENADLTEESEGRVDVSVEGASSWQEGVAYYANSAMDDGDGMGTYVLHVSWKAEEEARLELRFHRYDGTGRCLQFDIADTDRLSVSEGEYQALDCAILLCDANGHKAELRLADYCTVYPPLPVALGKLQYLMGDEEYKLVSQTCWIPLSAFLEAEPRLDLTRLTRLTFVFDAPEGGSVSLDNVGFDTEPD